MSTEIDRIAASKRRTRRELAKLPIEEKLCIVEQLRDNLGVGIATQRESQKNGMQDSKVEEEEKSDPKA